MRTLTFYGHTPPTIDAGTVPGRLIVVEGTDGVGRSTQIAMLREWLESGRVTPVLVTGFRRSELAAAGIDRAMRGNTLDATYPESVLRHRLLGPPGEEHSPGASHWHGGPG